jgi:hypothetical protein
VNPYLLADVPPGTTYVRALAISNCFDISSTTASVYVSATPVVTVTPVSATAVQVSWTVNGVPYLIPASPGVSEYTVSWSGAAGAGGPQVPSVAAGNIPTPFFTIGNLLPNAALTVTVTKTGPACAGTASGTASTSTQCAVPQNVAGAPVAQAAGGGAQQGLKVTWTAVAGATGYRVYYRPLGMVAGWSYKDTVTGPLAAGAAVSKRLLPLYPGAPYAVMVAANNCPALGQLGEASAPIYPYTNTVSPATLACQPVPGILQATSSCPTQISVTLTGGPVWRVTLRRLSPSLSAGITYQTSSTTGTQVINFGVSALATGSVWEVFAVTQCAPGVNSVISNVQTVVVKAPCEAPQNVVLSHATCHGFTVSWNAAACTGVPLLSYTVAVRNPAVTQQWNLYGVPVTGANPSPDHLKFTILGPLTTYEVYVRAVSCNGAASAASPVQTVTTIGCRGDEEGPAEQAPAQQAQAVVLYPNPTSGDFAVAVSGAQSADAVKIEIVDALGRVLQTDLYTAEGDRADFYVHPAPHVAAGLYLVRVAVGHRVHTQRLVIQKN